MIGEQKVMRMDKKKKFVEHKIAGILKPTTAGAKAQVRSRPRGV